MTAPLPGTVARRAWAILLGLVLGLLASVAGPASPASAHAVLIGTSPAMGSTVQDGPNQVVLTFTEGIEPIAGRNQVIAPDGSREDLDEARAAGSQLIILHSSRAASASACRCWSR